MQPHNEKPRGKTPPNLKTHSNTYLPYNCEFPELKNYFKVVRELGKGSYGVTYKLIDKNQPTHKYALKRIFPITPPKHILLEIYFLAILYNKPNIVNYKGTIRLDSQVDLLFDYVPHQKFSELILQLDFKGIKRYMFQLLSALRILESYGIIHRDVKPGNFLYSTKTNRGVLVDFGLSELV